jgi:hypothetical protein
VSGSPGVSESRQMVQVHRRQLEAPHQGSQHLRRPGAARPAGTSPSRQLEAPGTLRAESHGRWGEPAIIPPDRPAGTSPSRQLEAPGTLRAESHGRWGEPAIIPPDRPAGTSPSRQLEAPGTLRAESHGRWGEPVTTTAAGENHGHR